ncbi:MAG: uncharacterized protein QOE11_3312 [Solirubrobacteraceae bacterium]|nr:uncharacterized protein [Solirubrobacteraceae bacterium]
MTGTLINVGTILAGTLIGVLVGGRLPKEIQERVLAGLGLVVLVIGVDLALAWRDTNPLYVIGGVLLGGIAGEAIGIERRLSRLGDRVQRAISRDDSHSTVSEAFFTASLLFCVGPLAVVGAIQDGLNGDYQALATKALLDGFASVALAGTLGWGVALASVTVFVYQGAIATGATLFKDLLPEHGQALAALTSAGGVLIIGIALKLLDLKDVRVGNFLPALLFAPALYVLVTLF